MSRRLVVDPIASQVADSIKESIIRGYLPPGTRLIEQELADELGVSRTPLREALQRLTADGWLTKRTRRGVEVSPLTAAYVTHLYQVRAVLEGLIAAEFAVSASEEQRDALARLTEEMQNHAAHGRQDETLATGLSIHSYLMSCSVNTVAVELLAKLHERVRQCKTLSVTVEGRLVKAAEAHRQLCDAIMARDAQSAERVIRSDIIAACEALKGLWTAEDTEVEGGRTP